MEDKNGKEIEKGDVIDLHQTVNGENLFVVLSLEPIKVVYSFDLSREYEYDLDELFEPCKYSGEVDFEIIGNVIDLIRKL